MPLESTISPMCILIDQREKLPFAFSGIRGDVREGGGIVQVATRRSYLREGDYSVEGMERDIAIERKSLGDLFGTLGGGRARFQRELVRLSELSWAAVVVEADWAMILAAQRDGLVRSQLSAKTIHRSVMAWQMRFPCCHWWFCPGRAFAEVTTYRLLERAWRDAQKVKAARRRARGCGHHFADNLNWNERPSNN